MKSVLSLKSKADAKRRLEHVDLEVTRRCNLHCVHCSAYSKERGEEMSLKTIKRVLREAKSMGLQRVGLTGGEPFLDRKRFVQIANFCTNELNIPVHIHSNGTLISKRDAKWVKQIKAEISISFYGNTTTIHDAITGKSGSFSSTLSGLKNLISEKANVCVYFVPMKKNLHSVKPLIKMVYDMGIKHIRILTFSPTERVKVQFDNIDLSKKDVQEFNKELLDAQRETKIEINSGFCTSQVFSDLSILQGHEQCFAAENRIHIDTFGNVFPCTASSSRIIFSSGNVQVPEDSLESIWNDSPLLQFFRNFHRNPPEKCRACSRYSVCMSGCRVRISYKYGDVTIPDPSCRGPYDLKP